MLRRRGRSRSTERRTSASDSGSTHGGGAGPVDGGAPIGHARATISPSLALLLTVGVGLLAGAAQHHAVNAWERGPAAGGVSAEGFDTERAQQLLLKLCAGGPRAAGSRRAEVETIGLIADEFRAIAAVAAASEHGARLEFETHTGSGCFDTDFLNGFTNCYQDVSAIVARLDWPDAPGRHPPSSSSSTTPPRALLIAAHFDSFPSSPGAADNGVNVAAAVEALRTLAAGPAQRNPVMVLLNGAEEVNWVAVHAWATQHRWAKDYAAVLNLEAIGSGGRSVVFQLGPNAPWLARALGRANDPRGSIMANDLFNAPQVC